MRSINYEKLLNTFNKFAFMAMQKSMGIDPDAWGGDSPSIVRNLWCNLWVSLKMIRTTIRAWSQWSQLFWVWLYAASGMKASADSCGGCVWAEKEYLWSVYWMPGNRSVRFVGDQNVIKLGSWCPGFSLTLLRCPIKPVLAPMPAQHGCLQEGAEASYLSCSQKYEREGSQTHKGNWGNIVFLSEEFLLVRYEVSFYSGHC